MAPRRGLGRGLESLIPSTPAEAQASGLQEVEGARFAELPLDAIVPNPRQPRQVFDEQDMAELVHSIREVGLLQPVVVAQCRHEPTKLNRTERRELSAFRSTSTTLCHVPSSGSPPCTGKVTEGATSAGST